jgi:hypothetical protein
MMVYIRKNGLVTSSEPETIKHMWTLRSDPLAAFLNFRLEEGDGETLLQVSKQKFFNWNLEFCKSERTEQYKIIKYLPSFTSALESFGIQASRIENHNQRFQIYTTRKYKVKDGFIIDLIPTPEQMEVSK